MPGICGELAELLSTVQRPGDFFASGRLELLPPRLTVDGVGQIALPLLPVQAEQLIALAERAPYGRGATTIVDTSVRRTWQIGPDRVRLDGKHWQATLDGAVVADDKRSQLARLLSALTMLRDETRITAALALLTARRGHDKSDNAAILGAVALFPPERAAQMTEAIIASHASGALAPCCALLRAAIEGPFAAEPKHLAAAVNGLIASLPGDPALAPVDEWGRRHHVTPGAGVVADLVRIAEPVDAELARRLAAHLLAWPKTYGVDRALVPAVKRLLEGVARRSGAAMTGLLAACLAHLDTRAAEPLEAPQNWSRASDIRCSCEHCTALRGFLASPSTETWTLKAAERFRSHVEGEIRRARADLDIRTERRGSPHSLVCRKNSASYQRRVAQRPQDLADITILKGSMDAAACPELGLQSP
jgi:hypothetical protein